MNKSILSFVFLCCISISETAAQSFRQVYPTPQKIVSLQSTSEQTIPVPHSVRYVLDAERVNSYAMKPLKELLGNGEKRGAMRVVVGVKGDRSVRKYVHLIPKKTEGYYLSVSKKEIVIAGSDARGLFYGVQTLLQSMRNGNLPLGEVFDYPDVAYRGVVEGFYGTPWSYEDRVSQLKFYGDHKLNVYFYGPKNDPYHSVPNWRKPYPQEEATNLKELVKIARDNGVIFYWAIHPGQDIQWNDTDRDNLMNKFESMYQLGVRAFAVFFDDISGEGTKADKQAALLNYLHDHFVKQKGDVAPLVMCPTEYNRSWVNLEKGYLPTLGDKLNKDIEIMWTGNKVVACLEKEDIDWVNQYLKRPAYIWWNFPVTDYVRDHLLLGPVYGNSTELYDRVSGFLSNPMEHAEASKIALSSVADYTWNMRQFDSDRSWHHALEDLLPENADALEIFARNSSDLGPNGHQFRRTESENVKPQLAKLQETKGYDKQAAHAVLQECRQLQMACNLLLADTRHPMLIDEMRPWLKLGKLLGEYGQQVLRLCQMSDSADPKHFSRVYRQIVALQTLMYDVDRQENANEYQPGVKIGGLILKPTLDQLFIETVQQYNRKHGTAFAAMASYIPFSIESTLPQLANLPSRTKGKILIVNPSNEVILWATGQSFTMNLDVPSGIRDVSIDLGTKSIADSFTFEIKVANQWITKPLEQLQDKTRLSVSQLTDEKNISAVRLIQTSGKDVQVYFKGFNVTLQ